MAVVAVIITSSAVVADMFIDWLRLRAAVCCYRGIAVVAANYS